MLNTLRQEKFNNNEPKREKKDMKLMCQGYSATINEQLSPKIFTIIYTLLKCKTKMLRLLRNQYIYALILS